MDERSASRPFPTRLATFLLIVVVGVSFARTSSGKEALCREGFSVPIVCKGPYPGELNQDDVRWLASSFVLHGAREQRGDGTASDALKHLLPEARGQYRDLDRDRLHAGWIWTNTVKVTELSDWSYRHEFDAFVLPPQRFAEARRGRSTKEFRGEHIRYSHTLRVVSTGPYSVDIAIKSFSLLEEVSREPVSLWRLPTGPYWGRDLATSAFRWPYPTPEVEARPKELTPRKSLIGICRTPDRVGRVFGTMISTDVGWVPAHVLPEGRALPVCTPVPYKWTPR